MDVFALPEKSNMAVTESDPDAKVRKMSIVSDFRPTLSKHVRPKFILWISKKKKKEQHFLLIVNKVS